MKNKPIIGVTPLIDYNKTSVWMLPSYLKGLENAGALPLIMPFVKSSEDAVRFADMCDGFLFTGGQDIDPRMYHEEIIPQCGEISPERDLSETLLFNEIIKLDKPVFGICRGIQMINVLLGGTLRQDIPSQYSDKINHTKIPPEDIPRHDVFIVKDSPLHKLTNSDRLTVNSYHHQGICDLSPQLEIMAHAPDGLVEAVYAPAYKFIWAVQWHPELLFETDKNAALLFSEFVDKCR